MLRGSLTAHPRSTGARQANHVCLGGFKYRLVLGDKCWRDTVICCRGHEATCVVKSVLFCLFVTRQQIVSIGALYTTCWSKRMKRSGTVYLILAPRYIEGVLSLLGRMGKNGRASVSAAHHELPVSVLVQVRVPGFRVRHRHAHSFACTHKLNCSGSAIVRLRAAVT